ncbi:MAG: hypothetical protein SchgKO_10560 [Schleiferiaceae bacterium]
MKNKILAFLLFLGGAFSATLNGQNLDSLGLDDSPYLNSAEAAMLNSLLEEPRGDFDFSGKKVVFTTGSSGKTIISKSNFFKSDVIPWVENGDSPAIMMEIFTPEEKEMTGGYDVIVMVWVKVLVRNQKEKIIEHLKEATTVK